MSQTLAAGKAPRHVLTWSETNQDWQQILIPTWARRVIISPQTNPIKVVIGTATQIADAAAYVDDATHNAETIAGDAKYSVVVTAGRGNSPQATVSIYAATNPTVIEFAAEESVTG